MINKPEVLQLNDNFWELNPTYKIIFDDLYEKDKSKNKSKSSSVMWAMYLKLYPTDNPFYNLPDKEQVIKDKFLKDSKFNWKKYEEIESTFKDTVLTQAERSLYDWNEFMKKRDRYIKNTDYYFDEYMTDDNGDNITSKTGRFITIKGTAEQLDKAAATTAKLFADYEKVKKDLLNEHLKKGKGNKPLSASDSNTI